MILRCCLYLCIAHIAWLGFRFTERNVLLFRDGVSYISLWLYKENRSFDFIPSPKMLLPYFPGLAVEVFIFSTPSRWLMAKFFHTSFQVFFSIWAATSENRIFAYAKTKTQISFAVTTAKLISVFVFATRIVQSLSFLNTKFQASSHCLRRCSLICVGPGRKPRRLVFWHRGSYLSGTDREGIQWYRKFPKFWDARYLVNTQTKRFYL